MAGRPLNFLEDPLPRLVAGIAVPAALGMLFNTLFNLADMVCAGWLGTEAVAALSVCFPLFFLVVAVGSGISQGTTSLIAHALGAGEPGRAGRIFFQALILSLLAGWILGAAGILAAPAVLRFLGASGSYLGSSVLFIRVIFAGSPFFLLAMTLNSYLSASGRNLPYRNALIAGFFANCLLNPILMWGLPGLPRLGVGGLALATVLVQAGSCTYLAAVLRGVTGFGRLRDWMPDPRALTEILRQSLPASLNMVSIALGVLVLTWFAKGFGKEAVAGMGLGTRIEQIVLLPAIGISTAMLSITGQCLGAGIHGRIREAWYLCLKLSVSSMILGGIILIACAAPVLGLFTRDASVIGQGKVYLLVSGLTLAAYPILFSTVFMMQGLRKPLYGLFMGLYRQIVGPVLVLTLLIKFWHLGVLWVWAGFGIVTWSAAVVALVVGYAALRTLGTRDVEVRGS